MTTRELDGVTPFRVHEKLINHFVEDWERLCLKAFESVEILLKSKVENLCVQIFDRFKSSGLLMHVAYDYTISRSLTNNATVPPGANFSK